MNTTTPRHAAILLAKASITGASEREMAQLAQRTQAALGERFATVVHAFSEQGSPSLREALDLLTAQKAGDITIVPLLLPMEPGFRTWITGAVQRWRRGVEGVLPEVHLSTPPGDTLAVDALVQDLLQQTPVTVDAPAASLPAGSVIPPQLRRVLVCQGGPCNHAGAAQVWGHLRNEQKRLDLRNAGAGMMSARTSCLGPCNLGPVVQVFPEGTWYGGVDEAGVDRIIASHLLAGEVVADLAYASQPGKQQLR
ncbi:MAG: NAD(P)H-dependent oxidoreductase subunit E [Comamonas sp.]